MVESKRNKKMKSKKIINNILIIAGEIALIPAEAFLATPYKGGQLFSGLVKDWRRAFEEYKYNVSTANNSLGRLHQKGLIRFSYKGKDRTFCFTKKGIKKWQELMEEGKLEKMKIKKPEKWDGKWRIIIFDIPDTKKSARDALRGRLKMLGFYQMQRSVFVHPFASLTQIEAIREFYRVKKHVKIIITDFLEDGDRIRRAFDA